MDYKEVDLGNLNSGAVIDLFEEEFRKILDNIADENTDPEKVRSVTIKVKIKPSKDRSKADTNVAVTSALAPIKPHESFILLSNDGKHVKAFTTDITQPELSDPSGKRITEFPNVKTGEK